MTVPITSDTSDIGNLKLLAAQMRGTLVEMSHKARASHLGSALSCVDIVVAAYFNVLSIDPTDADDPHRDRFILSKGHAASALYAGLAYRGFFPLEHLDSYGAPGGNLPEHPSPKCVPGVEVATGSLGHGLSLGVGIALAGQIKKQCYRVYVLMSDGECNEGTVWEAALFAPAHKLENLVAIIDYNKWQATGRSDEIMAIQPLTKKWEAFGWSVHEIDGHDMNALVRTMSTLPAGTGKPVAIIGHTLKGKGVSFMEDDNNWHYRIPTEEEVLMARRELGLE
jgi:transketolase